MKKLNIHRLKNLIFISAVLTGLFVSSCEDLVNLEPFNQISETSAFSSPELVDLSVTGMYNAAQIGYAIRGTSGTLRGYPFGAAFVQQGDTRGEDAVNMQAFFRFTYIGTYDATTENNKWIWTDTYRLINRINIIIDGVRTAAANGIITKEKADEYEGEARLLRAAGYHELLINFARPYKHTTDASHQGVPYHDVPFTLVANIQEGMVKGRETVAFVYSKILEDLEFSETNLPHRSARTGNAKITRGTKGAAAAYKTRIYQHMYNWNAVITEGLKFLPGGTYAADYKLGATPSSIWNTTYTSEEYIYGMEHSASNNPGVNAGLSTMYKNRKLVCISPIAWRNAFWLADDKRREEGVMVRTRTSTTDPSIVTGIFTDKYKDDVNSTDPSPMMRLAEVHLNLAEAYAMTDQVALGLAELNKIRNRALADSTTQAYTSFANNVDLLEAILAERRIEFAMEGRRWPDIHRLQFNPHFPINGIPAKVANVDPIPAGFYTLGAEFGERTTDAYGVVAVPYANFKFVWPIPLDEINANPTLAGQQNPDY